MDNQTLCRGDCEILAWLQHELNMYELCYNIIYLYKYTIYYLIHWYSLYMFVSNHGYLKTPVTSKHIHRSTPKNKLAGLSRSASIRSGLVWAVTYHTICWRVQSPQLILFIGFLCCSLSIVHSPCSFWFFTVILLVLHIYWLSLFAFDTIKVVKAKNNPLLVKMWTNSQMVLSNTSPITSLQHYHTWRTRVLQDPKLP